MLVFDSETNGFLKELDTVHVLCIRDLADPTGKVMRFTSNEGNIRLGLTLLENADEIIAHNAHSFDVPALQKVYPDFKPRGYVWDSLSLVRLLWPDMADKDFAAIRSGRLTADFTSQGLIGLHSLKAWGLRLGYPKGGYEGDFAEYTQAMEDYCARDVEVLCKLVDLIWSKGYSMEAMRLECDVQRIIARQVRRGFAFDAAAAEKLCADLTGKRNAIAEDLRAAFGSWYEPDGKLGATAVDGGLLRGRGLFVPKRDHKAHGYEANRPLTKVKLTEFNAGSRAHIAKVLIERFGWEPTEFTEAGAPKVDDEMLAGLSQPQVKMIRDYLVLDKRLGALGEGNQAWLTSIDKDTGRIHGQVNTNGAVTGRMTHYRPNVAQVPAEKSPYGRECRSLFIAAPGYVLVGCDAEGLELRGLAHYMALYDGGAYALTVVQGKKADKTDPHSVTQALVGLLTRDAAKTWIYAYLYGAGDLKLGLIHLEDMTDEQKARFAAKFPSGLSRKKALIRLGKQGRGRVEQGLPALGTLQAAVKAKAATGSLRGIDGRILPVRHQHAALNTLLQSAGAIVMKKALVLLDQQLQAYGLVPGVDYEFVANIHDEFQIETKEGRDAEVAAASAASIKAAGVAYGFRCELAGASHVGRNWASTH